MKLEFHMSFVPEWRSIELMRSSIESILEAAKCDADGRAAIAMISAELMENAYKHGAGGESAIEYNLDLSEEDVAVTVSNQVHPDGASKTEKLTKTIEWIDTFDNPLDAYIEKMKILYDSDDAGAGGLGLVRIAYEGHCKVTCDIDSGTNQIEVKAALLPGEEYK